MFLLLFGCCLCCYCCCCERSREAARSCVCPAPDRVLESHAGGATTVAVMSIFFMPRGTRYNDDERSAVYDNKRCRYDRLFFLLFFSFFKSSFLEIPFFGTTLEFRIKDTKALRHDFVKFLQNQKYQENQVSHAWEKKKKKNREFGKTKKKMRDKKPWK